MDEQSISRVRKNERLCNGEHCESRPSNSRLPTPGNDICRTAIECAPYGVLVHDPEGRVLVFNSRLEKISGYKKAEIPNIQTWIAKVYPDAEYRKLVIEERKRITPEGDQRVREAVLTRRNGEKRICEFSSILAPSGIRTVFINDVSEEHQMASALHESEQRCDLLSETTTEAIIILKDDVLIRANDQFFALVGYETDELLGKQASPCVFSPEVVDLITRQIAGGFTEHFETLGRKKDGSHFPMGVHARPLAYKGHRLAVVAISDLSERKRTEEALRESQDRFREMAENIREVFWLFDVAENRVIYVSPAYEAIWDRPAEDVYKEYSAWIETIHPEDLKYVLQSFQRILRTAEEDSREYRIVRPDGSIRWIASRGFAIVDAEGKVGRLTGTAEDITDRKEAELALGRAHKELEARVEERTRELIETNRRLSREIEERRRAEAQVHDLTQQLIRAQEEERQKIARDLHDLIAQDLSVLRIGLATLFDGPTSAFSDEVSRKLKELGGALQRSIQAVRNLSYQLHPPDLQEIGLTRTVASYCEQFEKKTGIRVDFQCTGLDGLKIDFDTQINFYRVVQELLSNVRTHAGASRVVVKLVASFPNLILRIQDNGRGFNVEERLTSAAHEKRMGLRNTQERIRLLNGRVVIQSQPQNGTRILIEVPQR